MSVIDIRMTGDQLALLVDALETAIDNTSDNQVANEWEELRVYLIHRYTRRWGLPPSTAAAIRRSRPPRTD